MKLDCALVNICSVPIITVTNAPFHNAAWFPVWNTLPSSPYAFVFACAFVLVFGLSPPWHAIVLLPSVFTCFVLALDYFAYLICLLISWCDSGFPLGFFFFFCRSGVRKVFIFPDRFETYRSHFNNTLCYKCKYNVHPGWWKNDTNLKSAWLFNEQ